MVWISLTLLLQSQAIAGGQMPSANEPRGEGIVEAAVAELRIHSGEARLELADPRMVTVGDRLFVTLGDDPLGWFEPTGAAFVSPSRVTINSDCGALHAWCVRSTLVGELRGDWPEDAELFARVDNVSPGGESLWIAAGTQDGVHESDTWLSMMHGQPVARCRVLLAADDVSFCRVTPLATGAVIRFGDRLVAWPRPADVRLGVARSSVCRVDHSPSDAVWVAAPPTYDGPAEPRVEIVRGGEFVASGTIEQRGELFWRVAINPKPDGLRVRIGDDARIRSVRDIRERRYAARLSRHADGRLLIDAGETDGVTSGDVGMLYRENEAVGTVRIGRVQHAYSEITTDTETPAGDTLPGDTVRFTPPPAAPAMLGEIVTVTDDGAIAVRLTSSEGCPQRMPLAVVGDDGVVGVCVLVSHEGQVAVGFSLPAGAVRPLTVGDQVVATPQ